MSCSPQRLLRSLPPRVVSSFLVLASALALSACGDNGTEPGDELEPLVGAWRAVTLRMTNQANPSVQVDLVEMGAEFTISILGSGDYTASLSAFGQPGQAQMGEISVSGNQVTITQMNPPGPSTTATWWFEGELLILDGETAFDFNQDGTAEPADVLMELEPVEL